VRDERIAHDASLMGVEPGLCGTCRMARRIGTAKGSTFFRCNRAEDDPAYPKYPPLPVLVCPGYLPGGRPPAPEEAR
jgi:hypothetical protein